MNRKYLIPAMLALCSTGAFAQTATSSTKFVDVDADNDGAVTQSELTAAGSTVTLTSADADQNGTLSLTEYEAAVNQSSPSN